MTFGNFLNPTAIITAIITTIKIMNDPEKRSKILKMFSAKSFIINVFFIAVFSYYSLHISNLDKDSVKLKKSIKTALLGTIIALMAAVDMTLAPFWILFVASYYLDISN